MQPGLGTDQLLARGRELQVQIDDVYACPGACAGCMLSARERRVTQPSMPPALLSQILPRILEYGQTLGPLDRVILTFGLADHLSMAPDYVPAVYARAAAVIRALAPTRPEHSAVLVTMALTGPEAPQRAALEDLARGAAGAAVPLVPLVILDPVLLANPRLAETHRRLILAARDLFPVVDLSLNLSLAAIRVMPAAEIVRFALDHGFHELTVNWVPTADNAGQTLGDPAAIRDWLIAVETAAAGKPLGLSWVDPLRAAAAVVAARRAAAAGRLSPAEMAQALVPQTARHSLQIDPDGQLMVRIEAIGSLPQDPRFGFKGLGSVADRPIAALLAAGMPQIVARHVAGVARVPACAQCPVADLCVVTGFPLVARVAAARGLGRGQACPHLARDMLTRYVPAA